MKRFPLVLLVISIAATSASAQQDFLSIKGPKDPVRVEQLLNHTIPLDLQFRDESGRSVRLGDYFQKGRPVLLTLGYFRCPMLCNIVLDAMTDSISNLKFNAGEQFEIVSVSFDPRDTPADAAKKKETYIRRYGRETAASGWHFLTGDAETSRELANAVGFHYVWDAKAQQFAHGTSIFILTPDGKLSRYLFGIRYPTRDVRLALVEASAGKIGSITDDVLLLCYHYNPATGKYGRVAMDAVRAGGVVTMLGIGGFVFVMLRREKKNKGRES